MDLIYHWTFRTGLKVSFIEIDALIDTQAKRKKKANKKNMPSTISFKT